MEQVMKNAIQINKSIFKYSITDLMEQYSAIKFIEELDKLTTSLYDEVEKKYHLHEFKIDKKFKQAVKAYEEKVSAISKLWKNKIILDTNHSLSVKERDYHLKFQTYDYEIDKLEKYLTSLTEHHQKYFFMEWIKCNYRINKEMNWDELYGRHDEISDFCKYVDRSIKKQYNIILKNFPLAFTVQDNKEYDRQAEVSVTKQFVSKLLMSIKNTSIDVDKKKFCESFGFEYDPTLQTAFNKVNKQGNETTKKFINAFWMYLTDDEKAEFISNFKKHLS